MYTLYFKLKCIAMQRIQVGKNHNCSTKTDGYNTIDFLDFDENCLYNDCNLSYEIKRHLGRMLINEVLKK